MKIKVTVRVRHIPKGTSLYQYFSIESFYDFYLDEMFRFYRKLNDFIGGFYLNLPVKETSEGKSQFRIVYDTSCTDENTINSMTKDVEQSFDFEVPQKRVCSNCAYRNKDCPKGDKNIPDGENCPEWYETE